MASSCIRRRLGMECLMVDRKSTRLNSSHVAISYAVFRLKKKKHELVDVLRQRRARGVRRHGIEPEGDGDLDLPAAREVFFSLMIGQPPVYTLFPYTTLFR